jgi:hypothetical protein
MKTQKQINHAELDSKVGVRAVRGRLAVARPPGFCG